MALRLVVVTQWAVEKLLSVLNSLDNLLFVWENAIRYGPPKPVVIIHHTGRVVSIVRNDTLILEEE